MVENNEEEAWHIANWCAPWVDNGQRLQSYIEGIKETAILSDDPDAVWKIGCVLLAGQLGQDLTLARIASEMGLGKDIL